MSSNPLFQPFSYKSLSLANRIVMAPMTRSRSPNGTPGEDVAAYYRRRTEGGVGLIITEGTTVDRPGASEQSRTSRTSTSRRASTAGSAW